MGSANQVRSEQASAPMSSIQEDITPYLGLAAAAAGAGIGLLGNQDRATQLIGNSSTQTVERIVLSSLDAIGTAVTAHPYLICGTVVLCVLIGGTLYYFDRKHRRQMEMMENLMRTGNFTMEVEERPNRAAVTRLIPIREMH